LTDIKDYIASLPIEMERMKAEMVKVFDVYKILEEFKEKISKDEMDKKWIIFGKPKELLDLVEKRNKDL
jgi:dynein heavy chain